MAAESVDRIQRNIDRMSELIEDLTDLTRGRIGEAMVLDLEPVSVAELMKTLIDELSGAEQGGRVVLRERCASVVAYWDRIRASQLFSNLLANALAHSPPESKVLVDLNLSGETLRVEVINEGDPIPADLFPVLFQPFRRSGRDSTHLGVGLYIAGRIASSHGGRISVRSSSAEGTRFTVELPRQPVGQA